MQGLRTKRNGLVVLAVAAIALLLAVPALAQLDGFELDGNTSIESQVDWQSIFDMHGDPITPLPTGFFVTGFDDDYQLPDTTTYATGSKDTLPITPGWQCTKSNNVGDKVDIVNAYATATHVGDDLVLYFAIEISSPNGDSNIGMWFLKDGTVACDGKGKGAKDFTGSHQDGDIFVVSAFTNGGRTANVSVYEWTDGALDPNPLGYGGVCDPSTDQNACAITNVSSYVSSPWPSPDKNGGDLDPQTFFEGGVNLTNLGVADECFATYLANTRSSQSLTATIFDFSGGSFPVCNPSTTLEASASASITYTIAETNDGDVRLSEPPGGWVTANLSDGTACTGLTLVSKEGGNEDGYLDPGETFTFTCTAQVTFDGSTLQSVTLTATGHGIDPAGRDVTICPNGNTSGLVCDPDERDKVKVEISDPA